MTVPTLVVEGAVATITLRRPERANRLEPDDLAALVEHVAAVNEDRRVLVLRIASTGKYFCSGYDIGALGSERAVSFEGMVDAIEDARPATIAVLQGGVYGGATDLALACDFRVGTPAVDCFMPAARLGLHFYRRGLERYVSRLGLDRAKRLFLTAERIDADTMKAFGFLTDLVATERLEIATDALTATLSSMAPLALVGMKRHINLIGRHAPDWDALEADMRAAATSDDLKEGQAAWKEKRKPVFRGR